MSSIVSNDRPPIRQPHQLRRSLAWLALITPTPFLSHLPPAATLAAQEPQTTVAATAPQSQLPATVELTPSQSAAAGIRLVTPTRAPFSQSIKLTGQVTLNQDRLAHIYPIVSGQVDQVNVGLGDVVQEGAPLLVVHSREVGTAKLELYQAKLQLELAQLQLDLQDELSSNTTELLRALRDGEDITKVQERFAGRTIGDYRERLLQSYAALIKSNADVQRLQGIAGSGAISAKQLLAAEAGRNADAAAFLARLEQVEYELRTSLLAATQKVKEAQAHVAVSTTNLQIMGCSKADLETIDPLSQGESVSDFTIDAPFPGTVISKDVALREQVRPDTPIMSIADLSTVWIEANVYEKDVPLLQALKDQPVRVRNAAWPDREFDAKIFFTGEIMDESTRTIKTRAVASNDDHLLKPGMFVTIDFRSSLGNQPVLQVPSGAILDHEGKTFVFVSQGEGKFRRCDVQTGPSNGTMTVIENGLDDSDQVVATGGFILKSTLLESLLGEE